MKQYLIHRAYTTMSRMWNMQLPVRVAHEIYMLMKKLEPFHSYGIEQERKLVAKYNGEVSADGQILFRNKDDAPLFRSELIEMNDLEVEVEFEPVRIPFDAVAEGTLSPMDICNLDGFVIFGD